MGRLHSLGVHTCAVRRLGFAGVPADAPQPQGAVGTCSQLLPVCGAVTPANTAHAPAPCLQLGIKEKPCMCAAADASVIDCLAGMVDSQVPGARSSCFGGGSGACCRSLAHTAWQGSGLAA